MKELGIALRNDGKPCAAWAASPALAGLDRDGLGCTLPELGADNDVGDPAPLDAERFGGPGRKIDDATRPFCKFVTRARVAKGNHRCAAVKARSSKRAPLAVCRPRHSRRPYQEATPRSSTSASTGSAPLPMPSDAAASVGAGAVSWSIRGSALACVKTPSSIRKPEAIRQDQRSHLLAVHKVLKSIMSWQSPLSVGYKLVTQR